MAENITRHITHIKSKVVENGSPKLPTAAQIQEGEIGVNYAKGLETLSIKNESGDVVTFSSDNYYTEKKLGSGFTGANSANTVTKVIEDNELVWTNAYVAMSGIVSAHTASTSMHLTSAEKTKIDNMPSTFGTMASENTSDYYKKSDTSGKTEISTALNGKSNTGHTHDGTYAKSAFTTVKVGSTNVAADTTADTLTLSAGTFVSLTPDATNDKVTIGVSTGTSSSTIARGDHTHYIGDLSGASEFGAAAFLNVGDESGTVAAGDHNHNISNLEGVSDFANQLYTGITSDIGSSLGGAAFLNTGTTNGTVAAGNHTHTTTIAAGNSSNISLAFGSKYTLSAGGTSYSFTMPSSASTWTDNNRRCFYASGNTAANTNSKTASIGSATGWELTSGTTVGVKFTYTNTYTGSSNITLNVNSSGAKQIYYKGTLNPTKPNPNVYGTAGRTIYYMYDGTYWVWMGMDGYGDAAFLNTGTTAGTVAAGDHTHSGYVGTGTSVSTASGLTGGGNLSTSRTIGLAATGTAGTYYAVKTDSYGRVISGSTTAPSANSWRSIKINGTEFLTTATTSSALNLSGKTNITLTTGSTGLVSISATTGETSSTVAVGNHTHSTYQLIATSGTAAQLSAGTDTTQRVWTAAQIKGGTDALYASKTPTVNTANTYTSASTLTSTEPIVYCVCSTGANLTNQSVPIKYSAMTEGQQVNVIYKGNTTAATYTIAIQTAYRTTGTTTKNFIWPTGSVPTLTVPANGYVEVNYIKLNGELYVRAV